MFRLASLLLIIAILLGSQAVPVAAYPCATGGNPCRLLHVTPHLSPIAQYFVTVNADMRSGDFTSLGDVFAPGALLTSTDASGTISVLRGLPAITHWYQQQRQRMGKVQWIEEGEQLLSPTVVLAYSHLADTHSRPASHSVQLFVLQQGAIKQLNLAAYPYGR
jgi:hypothetical protein